MSGQEKRITFDEFRALAQQAQPLEMRGYIAWDGDRPEVVLFGYSPLACPNIPIPKDRIENMRLGSTHLCFGGAAGGRMWDATVYLKPPDQKNAEALAFVELLQHLSEHHIATAADERGEMGMPTAGAAWAMCGNFRPHEYAERCNSTCWEQRGHFGPHRCIRGHSWF